MRRLVAMLTLAVGLLFLLAGPAAAQSTEYPPQGGTGVKDFGAQRPGQSFQKEDCGFQPGSTAQVSLNNKDLFTKTVEADGCLRLTVEVQSANKIRIDGKTYDAVRCGQNVIRVSGTHRDGGTLAFNNLFRIECGKSGAVGAAGTARTGFETASYVGAGALLLGVGAGLVLIARRRREEPSVA